MKHYVYETINVINDKKYIGVRSHDTPYEDEYLGSGVGIKNAINKYGSNCFNKTIICCFDTRKEAEVYEEILLKKLDVASDNTYYNHCNNTFGGEQPHVKTEEWKKARSEKYSGNGNPFYGKTHTEDSKNKMSEWKAEHYQGEGNPFYGKTHTDEIKKIIGTDTKRRNELYGNPFKGKKHSKETLQKISISRRMFEYILTDPDGNEYHVEDLTNFCRKYNLTKVKIYDVTNNKAKHHKKWKAVKKLIERKCYDE